MPKGSGRLAGLALDRVVPLPVSVPSDLAFGGDALALDTLAHAPLSGRLFAVKADAVGVPAHRLVLPRDLD